MSGFGKAPLKDPFGLPTDEGDAYQDDGEFDLSSLEPKMRSIAIAMPPPAPFSTHALQGRQAMSPSSAVASDHHYELKSASTYHVSKPAINSMQQTSTASAVATTPKSAVLETGVPESAINATAELADDIEVPALPFDCTIFPLEVCHFYTDKSAKELKYDIEEALQSHNVAFEFDAQRFKFCCEYFVGTNVVKFHVRAYLMPDSRLVVEFQRRQGCCLVCSKIVSAIRETLVPEEKWGEKERSSFEPRITEALFAREADGTVAQEVVAAKLEDLRQCLSCGREDVKREFAKVLIPLSQLCPQSVCNNRAYAELVCTLVKSDVNEVRLAAVSCVANLAASLRNQGAVDVWFGEVLDSIVLALADASAHVRREAARALMYMSTKFPRAVLSHGGLEALRRLSECSDRTLSGYCNAAVHSLVSVC